MIKEVSDGLKKTDNPVIIIGPWVLSLTNCTIILDRIRKIISITDAKLYMPDPHGNLRGLLASVSLKPVELVFEKINKGEIDLIYLIGDALFSEKPEVKHLFYQSAFPVPEDLEPDVILPSVLWGEGGGTWAGTNGSPVTVKQVAKAHDYALSHLEIFTRLAIASKVKGAGVAIKNKAGKVPVKLQQQIPDNYVSASALPDIVSPGKKLAFILVQERSPHMYMNLDIGRGIEGMSELVKPGHVQINSSDAKDMEIKNGDFVQITDTGVEKRYPVAVRKNIPQGVLFLTMLNGSDDFEKNPCYVKIRRVNV